jgi:V/A-type H+-transporting ATPase subunit C
MKSRKGFSRDDTSGYAYTNTRIKAMKAKLLKKEDYQKFLKMSLAEIARYLQETEYNKEITELAVRFSGINLIEYASNKNLENTFAKILGFALLQPKGQVRLYLRRYDVANIKTILRGKFSKTSNEKISKEIIASGEFSRAFLENVIKESSNAADAIEHFKETEYYSILKEFSNDLTKLEDELDKSYYITVLGNAEKELKDYIRMEIAVKNALNRLRGRKVNIKVEIIPREKRINVPYQEDSVEARIFVKKLLIERAIRMVHEVKFNIRPILGYFIAKENEVSNIRVLTRGRHAGLSEELIQKQLVI